MTSDAAETRQSNLQGRGLQSAVFALGFSAMLTQLVLLREALGTLSGNEIVLGILLGTWLLAMGLGTFCGRSAARLRRPLHVLAAALLIVALLPPVSVLLLHVLRGGLFLRGAELGPGETALICAVVVLPYCLLNGYLLMLAASAPPLPYGRGSDGRGTSLSAEGTLGVTRVYFLDGLGAIAGGVLFHFLLVRCVSPFAALTVPAGICAAVAAGMAWRLGNRVASGTAVVIGAAACVALTRADLDGVLLRWEHPGAEIVFSGQSPYGKLLVTRSAGQLDFFSNGVPLFSTQNVEQVEEKVHFAMAQRPSAKHVLLLSGGASGTAKEILKYGVERVNYVEQDELIVQAARAYAPENLDDPRIQVICVDARVFVQQTGRLHDVVIVDLPQPSTAQLNRFYTREFFEELKRVLAPDGVISLSVGTYDDYLSPKLAQLIATTNATLRAVLANVLIVPAGRVFFLASNGELTTDIADRLEANRIAVQWMKRSYLRSVLTPDRMGDMQRAAGTTAGVIERSVNTDLAPVLYYQQLQYWSSKYKVRYGILAGALAALLGIYLWRIKAVPLVIFSAGFSAAGLEFILLLGFQIVFGSVYHQLALLITAFMAGLALGSGAAQRWLSGARTAHVIKLGLLIAAFSALLPLMLMGLARASGASILTEFAFAGLALGLAFMVSLQFGAAGQLEGADGARLFSADYLGAALGAVLVSTILVPWLGVTNVCVFTAVMNVVAVGVLRIQNSEFRIQK